jgi:hypothetical protein
LEIEMPYTKQEWTDEELADEALYDILDSDDAPINEDVKIELTTDVIAAGTSVTAERMNHIEDGIETAQETGEAVAAEVDDIQDYLLESATEVTVSSGVLTVTKSRHTVQPESGTSDDIDTITGIPDGGELVLSVADLGTDTLIFKHGTDNLSLPAETDITLTTGAIRFYRKGSTVYAQGGGGGGGLTNSATSVTTSNVTGVAGTRHILDVSGMTANRDFNLPTPSAAGQLIAVQLSAGDDTYELIVKRNGTEITRLFIAGEKLEFVSTGTGAGDWIVTHDGRIPCATLLRRITTDANTTHGAGVHIHAAWNDATINRGNCANLTNVNIKIRRAGYYKISGVYAPAASMADQNYAISTIWKNATVVSGEIAESDGTRLGAAGARLSSTVASSLLGGAGVLGKIVSLAAGDTIWYTFATETTNRGLLRSDSDATLLTELTYFQVDEVLSALV